MIIVTGRVTVAAENSERFAQVAIDMCRSSRDEEGCAGYRIYRDLEDEDRYVFVEEWVDEEALQVHFGQPHTATFMGALSGLLAGPADALFHTTASTRRLDGRRGLVAAD